MSEEYVIDQDSEIREEIISDEITEENVANETTEDAIEFQQVEVDKQEILESISLKPQEDSNVQTKETQQDIQVEEKTSTTELENIPVSPEDKNKVESDVKVVEDEDDKVAKDLFNEFRTFLENRAGITEEKKDKLTIPTGIDILDAILGGGFAVGVLNIIVGQPGSGKSMLAMQTMAQGQKMFNGQILCAYLDSEEATTTVRLANLGVRYPKIKPYTDLTVEKVFRFLEALCVFKQEKRITSPSVLVWDSIANTLTQKEREADDPNSVIGYKARVLSILIPKYVAKCAENNICFLAVNQLRDVLSMGPFTAPRNLKFMTSTKVMPGGNILDFNAFQLVEMKLKSAIAGELASKYGFEGIITKAKCVKNKLFPPNVEVELVGSFVTGFSNFWTNYQFLVETKRLKAGAWNYLVSLPDRKFRTKDAEKMYNDDETFKQAFDLSVKQAIQQDLIEKYNPVLTDV